MFAEPDYAHVERLANELARRLGYPTPVRLRVTQGGFSGFLGGPIDPEIAAQLARQDPLAGSLRISSDEVACFHCWANFYGDQASGKR